MLYCCYTKITQLDNLPNGLVFLYCDEDVILNNTPPSIETIIYADNNY
jgi:hypothetical protein